MAEAKKPAPKVKPEAMDSEMSPEEQRIQELRDKLAKEQADFESAKAEFEAAQVQGPGAQGHGVKLAPNRAQLNEIRRLWLAGGSPSGISVVTRVALKAVASHCEDFIRQGLEQAPGTAVEARTTGAKKGPVPGLGKE